MTQDKEITMEIEIDTKSRQPILEQVVGQIRRLIENGRLTAGEELPAVKALADELNISRLTTGRAYDRLCSEGLLLHRSEGFVVAGAE